jgi:hypothetical protein
MRVARLGLAAGSNASDSRGYRPPSAQSISGTFAGASKPGLIDHGTGEITRLQQALVRSARREEAPVAVRPSCQLRRSGF